ncbi:MAG: transposase [Proteobacteria bacterium]|nr:transposase [Pseudomonadota bacterium]
MPDYIRPKIKGGRWFFTVNLMDRHSSLLTDNIAVLREATTKTKRRYPFRINAMVVLPDHLHAVWTLPEDDADFSVRWRLIKSHFSKAMPASDKPSKSRIKRGERGIWQRRFWEHAIRDECDHRRHLEYCYINPVKHGHVQRVRDWPYSSFHRDVRAGLFPEDWAGDFDENAEYGERL